MGAGIQNDTPELGTHSHSVSLPDSGDFTAAQ